MTAALTTAAVVVAALSLLTALHYRLKARQADRALDAEYWDHEDTRCALDTMRRELEDEVAARKVAVTCANDAQRRVRDHEATIGLLLHREQAAAEPFRLRVVGSPEDTLARWGALRGQP